MKKTVLACTGAALLLAACGSGPKVTRTQEPVDLSGKWNAADVRIVCDSLITECLASGRIDRFISEYTALHGGKLPTVIVGQFKNASSEHIDTSIIAKSMEIAIVNSGKLDFVAGGETRENIRTERQDQQTNASEESASSLGNETAADFMLTGAVKTIVDQAGNTTVRSYFVSAELTSIETNTRLWMGENNEIQKVIQRPKYKP